MIRLHVEAALAAGVSIEATEGQAHYLASVMRRAVGDPIRLFNGTDGEWTCRIAALSRGKAKFIAESLARAQSGDADLWLVFAVLKRDATDLVVQKSTELGVSTLLPTFTERTNSARVNLERLRSIAVEAAEQSERLTVPVLQPARQLHEILTEWPAARPLFVAMERADAPSLSLATARSFEVDPTSNVNRPLKQRNAEHEGFNLNLSCSSGPAALLIGPEGGFGPRDHAVLRECRFVRTVSLGPRILRAETAAIVGLTLLQARGCAEYPGI